jgi:Secretion system C-terminal sorting domain
MKSFLLLVFIIGFSTTNSSANPLLGIWNKIDGPSSVLKYNYLTDSTVILTMTDSSNTPLSNYVLDSSVTPHRITWYFGHTKGNLGIWSISGNTLTVQGSSGDTTTFPPSFTEPSHYGKQATSVKDNASEVPKAFYLLQNYPNPFNPTTTIVFTLPTRSFVSLKIFDLLGREVTSIISEEMSMGNYSRQWNAASVPSGTYFCRLQAGTYNETRQLLLLK